jgi:hypothetical protein
LWNPYFGYFFFIASISAALAVLRRHHWWWPVVVVTGSVAAQAHLMYLVPELGICGLALARLLLRCLGGERPLPWRPLATGVGLGCGCWLGPLLQQVSGHPGNLSSIVDAGSETVPRAGWQFGLEAVAFATGPRPGWAIADPATSRSLFSSLSSSSAVEGGVVVLALVLVALTAWRTGALELATVAVVSWMLTVSLAVSFAELPVADFKSLYYLETLMLPVGCFTLVTLLVAVTVLVRALARRVFEARRRRHPAGAWSPRRAMVLGGAALGLVVSGCLIRLSTELPSVRSWSSMGEVRSAAAEIGASPHRDTIRVDVEVADGGGIANYGYTLGVAWALVAAGWDPLVGGVGAVVLGGVDAGGASAVMTALVSFGPGGSAAEVISGPLNYHELYRWRLRVQADDHAP